MGCDCTHFSRKVYGRIDPNLPPPGIVGKAHVTINSSCENVGGDQTEPMFVEYRQQQALGQDAAEEKGACFNYITVTRVDATAGWTINDQRSNDRRTTFFRFIVRDVLEPLDLPRSPLGIPSSAGQGGVRVR